MIKSFCKDLYANLYPKMIYLMKIMIIIIPEKIFAGKLAAKFGSDTDIVIQINNIIS